VSHYVQYAQGDVNNARGYLDEAIGYLRQASSDDSVGASYGALAAHELSTANASLNKANGYFGQISAGLRVAQTARLFREEGERRLTLAKQKLQGLASPSAASY
jgi:hypothetical protein